jgi:hypothetical protein
MEEVTYDRRQAKEEEVPDLQDPIPCTQLDGSSVYHCVRHHPSRAEQDKGKPEEEA